MRAPIALLALLVLAGCTIVDDTRPAVGGATGPADPGAYLKPVAKPTPATRDPGLQPQAAGSAEPVAPAPTPVAVEADPEAPTGEEPEEEGEEPTEEEEAGGV